MSAPSEITTAQTLTEKLTAQLNSCLLGAERKSGGLWTAASGVATVELRTTSAGTSRQLFIWIKPTGKSSPTSEPCASMQKIVAGQKSAPLKMAGELRAKAKDEERETPTKLPGAQDCYGKKPMDLYPEVICTWPPEEKQLSSLAQTLRICFPEFAWKLDNNGGAKGTWSDSEKNFFNIQLQNHKVYKRIILTFERKCWTTECFNELHPGILDGTKAAEPTDYYDE